MYEKAKEYLKQYQIKKEELQTLYDERAELYSVLDVGSIGFESDGSSHGSSDTDKRSHIHTKMADIDLEIDKRKVELMKELHSITSTIRKVEDKNQHRVLFLRYIKGYTFEAISVDIGYSYPQTHRYHAYALKTIDNMIKNDTV